MQNDNSKKLCLDLMKADSEAKVISLLKASGYWDDPDCWRLYGDKEENYREVNNQQNRSDASIVEKIINSVDAKLMNECLVRGIRPDDRKEAPGSIREAVAIFFEKQEKPIKEISGRISEWPDSKRTEIAKGITLAATEDNSSNLNPCFTISDSGEGQTPEEFPNTLVSLGKSIKDKIWFVQGKYNMGGTGVIKFCGKQGLQLILSRRNPSIVNLSSKKESDDLWGFTIVRREFPKEGFKNSVIKYLSPINSNKNPSKGGVLRFKSKTMPIFPEASNAFKRSRMGNIN